MDKTKLELKVGVFIFGAIVVLSVFILKISNLKGYGVGYPLKIIFGNVSGVKAGSPVRLAGVNVGEVRSVSILNIKESGITQIEVSTWIRKTSLIPQGSQAYVNTLGLLGEKYIEIIPPLETTAFLKPGAILLGNDPVMVQHWFDEGEKIVKDLQEIIEKLKQGGGTAGKLLNDDKLYTELEGLISDIRQARQGTLGRLLYDDKLYKELEALITDLRRHPWKLFWKSKERPEKKK